MLTSANFRGVWTSVCLRGRRWSWVRAPGSGTGTTSAAYDPSVVLIVNGCRYDSVDKIRLPTKLYVDDRDDNVIKVIELSTKFRESFYNIW